MLYTVRHIRVWSVVRIAFFIFAITGFLAGMFWGTVLWAFSSLVEGIVPQAMEAAHVSGLAVIFLAFVLGPVYGVVGSVGVAVAILIYNLVGKLTGGIELELAPGQHEVTPTC